MFIRATVYETLSALSIILLQNAETWEMLVSTDIYNY